jgi:hypothetical protein
MAQQIDGKTFSHCPTCQKYDARLQKCVKCNHYFCWDCRGVSGGKGSCPNCRGKLFYESGLRELERKEELAEKRGASRAAALAKEEERERDSYARHLAQQRERRREDAESPQNSPAKPGFLGRIAAGAIKAVFGEAVKVGDSCPSCESRVGLGRSVHQSSSVGFAFGFAGLALTGGLVALAQGERDGVGGVFLGVVAFLVGLGHALRAKKTRRCTGCGERFGKAEPDEID